MRTKKEVKREILRVQGALRSLMNKKFTSDPLRVQMLKYGYLGELRALKWVLKEMVKPSERTGEK